MGATQPDLRDPWRRRMWRTAERLRLLDESRFQPQIARIEECLRKDAAWSLEAALESCDRWYGSASPCRARPPVAGNDAGV